MPAPMAGAPPIDPRCRVIIAGRSMIPKSGYRFSVKIMLKGFSRGNPIMNVQDRSNTFDLNKYGVGQPVLRTEDPVLVQGQGKYTDDISLPGQAYAAFVRSRNGHGIIKSINAAAAKAMPGVLAIYTGHDLAAYGTMK